MAKSYVGAPPVSWRPLLIGVILDPPLFNAVDSLNGVVYLDQEDEALVALRMLTVFMTSSCICVCINMCVLICVVLICYIREISN